MESTTSGPAALNRRGLADLLIVYLVWGSTYFAIRFAVREGAGFPPFTLAFMRVFVASIILLAMGSIWYQRRKSNLKVRAVSGWQHLLGGVGFLVVIILRGEPLPAPTQEAWQERSW